MVSFQRIYVYFQFLSLLEVLCVYWISHKQKRELASLGTAMNDMDLIQYTSMYISAVNLVASLRKLASFAAITSRVELMFTSK